MPLTCQKIPVVFGVEGDARDEVAVFKDPEAHVGRGVPETHGAVHTATGVKGA